MAELDFTYYNAVHTVENALAKVKDEKGIETVEKFLKEDVCPACGAPACRRPPGPPGSGASAWTRPANCP